MIQFTKNEKYALVKILSQIMNADGIIHPKEEEFMDNFFKEQAIKIEDLEDCSSIEDIQSRHIIRMMSPEKINFARCLFLSMAKADGYIHPKELSIINEIVR